MRQVRLNWLIGLMVSAVVCPAADVQAPKRLSAQAYNSGFPLSNGTFNGMLAASDGKIYYVLCAASIDTGAQMFAYDPATDQIRPVGDLT
ncbi:MAG: hypothetical protein U0Q18_21385 [Bryobacteraceae bacterium]